MPAPTAVSDFLECVRKSGVLEPSRLEEYLARVGNGAPATPARMADAVVAEGLLTRFQADQLLRGRWRNFILCGKYIILEPIGSGGMATVYLCLHRIMRRPVAVKVLPPAQVDDPGALERFHREAQAVAQLRHPNIVGAYDVDRDGKFHFIVMEYVDGVSLHDLVKTRGPLDPIRAAHYVRQAALGLEHAHQAGLIHRDVKPANLIVDRAGVVKILDLGLARFFRDPAASLTEKYDGSAVLGTADYLAPEQAVDSHNVDIRCDIYSLGVTFYYLLSGRSPFQEGSTAEKLIWHQVRTPQPIRELSPETPEGLAAVLERMTAKEPARRFQTPAEVADALAPWTQTPIGPPSDDDIPPPPPAARVAGAAAGNEAAPETPSPHTPSHGAGPTPRPGAPQDDVATRKDNRTTAMAGPPATMKTARAAPTSAGAEPGPSPDGRPFPWLRVGAGVLCTLVLVGVGLAAVVAFLHPAGMGGYPPQPSHVTPETGPSAGPPVAVAKDAGGLHVHTAKYDAHIGADGCLDSFKIGDAEYLMPGEPLLRGKSVARGAYFYSDKAPHPGAIPLPRIAQPADDVVQASEGQFSVKYRFSTDSVNLTAVNDGADTTPFFIVLNSAAAANVADALGERFSVPAVGNVDAKWAATTWVGTRSALKIERSDPGATQVWGPFGQAKSQVWHGDVAGAHAAEIRLAVAPAEETPGPPRGRVVVAREDGVRRIRANEYEAVMDADGCITSMRVDSVEFFKPGVDISRGAYFHQNGAQQLPLIAQWSPTLLGAAGPTAGLACEFGPSKLTLNLENKTDSPMSYYIVFDPAVRAVRNGQGQWAKTPSGRADEPPDEKWRATTWYAGRAKLTITGGSKAWGPWQDSYQVWEAVLGAREKRTVVLEVGRTTADEAKKVEALAP